MEFRNYNIHEVVTFRKTTEKFGGLSNMAAGYGVVVNNVIIPSAEHLYQAMRYPHYPQIQNEIISQVSPMTAKMISKKYYKYSRPDWDFVRIKIMRWVLEIKLSQNWDKFNELLLTTENKAIVEFTYKDKVWGAVQEGNHLVGINALGRLLMELREKYTLTNTKPLCVNPLEIQLFNLYSQPIDVVCNDILNKEIYYSDIYELEELY
ncbi:NADAR family protein [Flavobacterium oreochromis]|uniref:NADAR family protein n=1 Tax=Flavobacterium oreochromis TaxID=2906078 RepID=UPI00385BD493